MKTSGRKQTKGVSSAMIENSISESEGSIVDFKREKLLLRVTGIIFLVCVVLYFLLGWKRFPIPETYVPLAQKIVIAVMFISLVLLASTLLKRTVDRKIEDKTTAFNFDRIVDLFAFLLILVISLSLLFAKWYAALVSFGIISLIIGFALQNPIASFFGWLYILIKKPFKVGDRIRIGNVYGDVINLSYIDTTLWEFNGDYLSGDHPSGRIIRFANSKVFSEYVFNYSWPLFPFIWNEFSLFISYDSDFKFTRDSIKLIVETEIGEAMVKRVRRIKKVLADTPVDELNLNENPTILFSAHYNTWIEVIVRYLVEPKSSGRVRTKLFEAVMKELKKSPEKVRFPNTNIL
jgi:small-conductance mechanosensitive channel